MKRSAALVAGFFLLVSAHFVRAAERYPASGMILSVDRSMRMCVVSIDRIPGVVDAGTVSLAVRNGDELAGLVPGTLVDFTLAVDGSTSYAEGLQVRRQQNMERDPMAAHRLALLKAISGGRTARALEIGDHVPDFSLTDQKSRPFSLSQVRGKVVAIDFMYTSCQLPDFCLRLVNHFGVLQKRFGAQLGRELVFLTVTFDPVRDRPDVLARYASRWNPDPDAWRFLTGPVAEVRRLLEMSGVSAFGDEGLMDHSLKTLVLDCHGNLAAAVEGNRYSTDQLGDLLRAVVSRCPGTRIGGR